MILAIGALLLHLPAVPQSLNLTNFSAGTDNTSAAAENSPRASTRAPERPTTPDSAPEVPVAAALIQNSGLPALPLSAGYDSHDRSGNLHRGEWLALTLVQHGAVAFDAWSTRRAISTGRFQEANPLLRPFAGNSSLYVTIQIAPLLFDYVGRRMVTSRHGWLRHTWWIPQVLSAGIALGSGVHNLSVR